GCGPPDGYDAKVSTNSESGAHGLEFTPCGLSHAERTMKLLLMLSRAIDSVNTRVGQAVTWLAVSVVLVSAGNAVIRKFFHISSNSWLELQWYLFGAIFLLAAGYTFLRNEHVRVDILSQRFSKRTQIWIEMIGVVFFLLPACALIFWL